MIRVFPHRTKWTPTDELAFIGEPPLAVFRPEDPATPVMVSCTFTWDLPLARSLAASWRRFYSDVRLGGPAMNDPGGEFVRAQFIKDGVTITSRGCPRRCPWCQVWQREGDIRTLPIVPGHIVQDNNLLACPRPHIEAVFDMLRGQHGVVFSGGLDCRLFESWHREQIETLRYSELWFACDNEAALPALERVGRICEGVSINKMRCYVMIGFAGDTLDDARRRLDRVYNLGFLPFAQLYRPPSSDWKWYPIKWRELARKWSRPAAYRTATAEMTR